MTATAMSNINYNNNNNNNTAASSSICDDSSTGEISAIFVVVYSTTFVVGLVSNLTALVVFCRFGNGIMKSSCASPPSSSSSSSSSSSHTTLVYMTNLAVADLLLVLVLPLRVYHHLGFVLPQWLCEWAGLVLLVNMYSSVFLLTVNCFDRCVAVSFPMSSRVRQLRRKSWAVCLGIWLFTVGSSLPSRLLQKHEDVEPRCFGSLPVYSYTQPGVLFSTLTIGFGIPLTAMLCCSWGLLRAVGRSPAVAQTPRLVDSGKIQRLVAGSLAIFLLSFLPYHTVLGLLYLYRRDTPCPLLGAYRYALMVACLNAMLDPIVYYFTTETFRRRLTLRRLQQQLQPNSQSSALQGNHHTEELVNS